MRLTSFRELLTYCVWIRSIDILIKWTEEKNRRTHAAKSPLSRSLWSPHAAESRSFKFKFVTQDGWLRSSHGTPNYFCSTSSALVQCASDLSALCFICSLEVSMFKVVPLHSYSYLVLHDWILATAASIAALVRRNEYDKQRHDHFPPAFWLLSYFRLGGQYVLMAMCKFDFIPGSLDMGEKMGDREDSLCDLSLYTDCNHCYVPIL